MKAIFCIVTIVILAAIVDARWPNRPSNRPRPPRRIPNNCHQPSETGPCRALMHRWFYNTKIKKCEMFTYGGCMGNGNRYSTFDECMKKCGKFNNPLDPVNKPGGGIVFYRGE